MHTSVNITIMALDVGGQRIGVAIGDNKIRLAKTLKTLDKPDNFIVELKSLIDSENIGELVVGLPRGLEGQDTQQTNITRNFTEELKKEIDIPIHFQDEALTSRKAEEELNSRGKPYSKGDIDALAAVYILEDFFHDQEIQ